MRYAARQAAAAAAHHDTTAGSGEAAPVTASQDRRADTIAAVDAALAALRDDSGGDDPAVHDAYLTAVLDHGAVLRDAAALEIERAYVERGLDDAAVEAETAAVAEELTRLEGEWARTRKDSEAHLTADGTSFTPHGAAAIDAARNAYGAKKQEIYRRAMTRSKEINEQRTEIAKRAYYEELSRERRFGGPPAAAFVPSNTKKMTRADRAMFTSCAALYPDEMVEHADGLGDMLAKRSKARAHYTSGAAQRSRRSHTEVFDLEDALQTGRFRFNHFVTSPEEAARV